MKNVFKDEGRRKSIIVGVVVFVVVFVGLMVYQQGEGKAPGGDVIVTGEGAVVLPEEGENSGWIDTDSGTDNNARDTEGGIPYENTVAGTIFVDVGGAVEISGLFALPAGSRVADAIEAAGGLREGADITYLNRATVLVDGDRLYVPTESEVRNGTAPPSAGQVTASGGYNSGNSAGGTGVSGADASANNSGLINLNTAGSDELQKLNGVGPATAQKIIDYREKRGGFKSIQDLMNVSGIGAKTFEKMQDYITV